MPAGSVVEAFVRLHEQGLIYRGSYLVNWSPGLQVRRPTPMWLLPCWHAALVPSLPLVRPCQAAEARLAHGRRRDCAPPGPSPWPTSPPPLHPCWPLQTAVSDLEVEYSEEPGTMFYFKYPVGGCRQEGRGRGWVGGKWWEAGRGEGGCAVLTVGGGAPAVGPGAGKDVLMFYSTPGALRRRHAGLIVALHACHPQVADSEEHLPVATTRPETILGDTAVAVHPEDPRCAPLLGRLGMATSARSPQHGHLSTTCPAGACHVWQLGVEWRLRVPAIATACWPWIERVPEEGCDTEGWVLSLLPSPCPQVRPPGGAAGGGAHEWRPAHPHRRRRICRPRVWHRGSQDHTRCVVGWLVGWLAVCWGVLRQGGSHKDAQGTSQPVSLTEQSLPAPPDTPQPSAGHDVNDYELGKRFSLPIINIMNDDGTLNEAAGPYAGLDRFAARKQLWADMQVRAASHLGVAVSCQPHGWQASDLWLVGSGGECTLSPVPLGPVCTHLHV